MALPQPLHIFRKDLLHLWPETLVVVLLFVAFAWSAPSGWSRSEYVVVATLLAGFLKFFLMPVSWLVVISRLIHDENLVGDRQFWTSRPYRWASLLAAKALYLAVFLYLPFLLMQVYLLKHAGLYPTLAIPALLHNLVLLTVIVVIPLTAIAAVTGTFARMLLSTIGAILYVLFISLGVLYLVFRRMPPPGLGYVLIGLIILLPLAALVYQYATRRTSTSRLMLAGTPLLVALLLFVTPATALIRHAYPVASPDAPRLGSLPEALLPRTAPAGQLRTFMGRIPVGLPVTVGGADEKSQYVVQGTAASVSAGSTHWDSPYLTDSATEFGAFSPIAQIPLVMPVDVFDKVANSPADVHLSLAVEHFKAEDPTTWKATLLPFSVPGHGICSYASDDSGDPPVCRFAFSVPEYTFLTAQLATGECGSSDAPQTPGRMSLGNGAASLDFDPVVTVPLAFPTGVQGPQPHRTLCPGTPLEFFQAKSQGKMRIEVDEKQVILAPFAARFPERILQRPAPTQP